MKKNFRCTDDAAWEAGLEKAEAMRREGYDIDMTSVLNSAVRQFADEKPEQSAARVGLAKGPAAGRPPPRRPGRVRAGGPGMASYAGFLAAKQRRHGTYGTE